MLTLVEVKQPLLIKMTKVYLGFIVFTQVIIDKEFGSEAPRYTVHTHCIFGKNIYNMLHITQ